jgi:hypothetical protein
MTKLKLLAAATFIPAVIAGPAMAQEATQEPGLLGFYYPHVDYLTGGYGVHQPPRYRSGPYGAYAYSPVLYRPAIYRYGGHPLYPRW